MGVKKERPYIDITGQRFGKLVAIKRMRNEETGRIQWLCKCDCGNEVYADMSTLKAGFKRSCGCSDLRKKYDITNEAKCWTCIRSAAPMELQCSWARNNELPVGAEHEGYIAHYDNKERYLMKIIYCPEYLNESVEENKQMLKDARKRKLEQEKKRVRERVSIGTLSFAKGGVYSNGKIR